MLDDKTKDRIKKDAEKLYPYASVNFETITGRNDVQKMKSEAYIKGREAEAERSSGLVEALQRVKSCCLATGGDPITRDRVINDILKGVENALNQYNNPVNK